MEKIKSHQQFIMEELKNQSEKNVDITDQPEPVNTIEEFEQVEEWLRFKENRRIKVRDISLLTNISNKLIS